MKHNNYKSQYTLDSGFIDTVISKTFTINIVYCFRSICYRQREDVFAKDNGGFLGRDSDVLIHYYDEIYCDIHYLLPQYCDEFDLDCFVVYGK